MENMWELETCTLKVENKSHQDFLLVHQAVLHQAPQSLKEDLHSLYSLLLGPSSSSHQSITLTPTPQVGGQPLSTISLKPEPKQSPPPKRQHSSMEGQGDTSMDEDIPIPSQGELLNPKEGKTANWLHLHEVQPRGYFYSRFRSCEGGQGPLLLNSLLELGS